MKSRKSIHVSGFQHGQPIPSACRIGNMVMSGVINGVDPETGKRPDTLEAQCRFMFGHVKNIVAAAGGTADDIIKVTVWMRNRARREVLNAEWQKLFPDVHSSPARHTIQSELAGDILVQCEFVAVLCEDDASDS